MRPLSKLERHPSQPSSGRGRDGLEKSAAAWLTPAKARLDFFVANAALKAPFCGLNRCRISTFASSGSSGPFPKKSGVLSDPDFMARLELPLGHNQRLSVIPFKQEAVNAASLDVHLGNWFAVARRTRLGSVKLGDKAGENLLRSVGREEVFVSEGQTFLIHPGDLLLGATLEFIALPPDTMGSVEGNRVLAVSDCSSRRPRQSHPAFTAQLCWNWQIPSLTHAGWLFRTQAKELCAGK